MSLLHEITHAFHELAEVHFLSIPTWLAVGAALQLIACACLPARLSSLPSIIYLAGLAIKITLQSRHIFTFGSSNIKQGRWTAELPVSRGDRKDDGMVMFVLGARMNHPLGPLAPGNDDVVRAFEAMWKEAETNRDKWGFLGQTGALIDSTDAEGVNMTWLSYWKNLEGLGGFATSAAHRLGAVNYEKKKYPNMGIMHETYHAPKGHWETIYDNMPPWGLAGAAQKNKTVRPDSSHVELQPKSSGIAHSSMIYRMRRNAGIKDLDDEN